MLDSYPGDRILVAEAWVQPAERLARYVRPDEMHQAFNFEYLVADWTRAGPVRGDRPARWRPPTRSARRPPGCCPTTTWCGTPPGSACRPARAGRNGIGIGDPQPDAALGLRRARAATLLMLALPGSAYLYQGEELGLPEHTTLPDEARQDPTWERSRAHRSAAGTAAGCRSRGRPTRPSYGFGPDRRELAAAAARSGREYALDRQRGRAGSTYEMYRDRAAAAPRARAGPAAPWVAVLRRRGAERSATAS